MLVFFLLLFHTLRLAKHDRRTDHKEKDYGCFSSIYSSCPAEHNLLEYSFLFCQLAQQTVFNDETLKYLYWIGANYHRQADLPDIKEDTWREAVLRCLENVYPRSFLPLNSEPSPQTPCCMEMMARSPSRWSARACRDGAASVSSQLVYSSSALSLW